MAEKLTVAAGRNIRFLLAVQSLAQVAHVYGEKAAEILLGNCDTWLYLRAADNETARAISQKAGTYTVKTVSVQRRPGLAAGGTEGAAGRPLLTPDEVLRWPAGQALLLQAGQYPARLPLPDLSTWREANAAFATAPAPEGQTPRAGPVPTWVPRPESGMVVSSAGQRQAGRERDGQDIFGRRGR